MNSNNTTLSVLIITYNEVDRIDHVIKSVFFADEIIIVDSNSTDGTIEKIHKYPNVSLCINTFKDFADQRNFAIKKANMDWFLFVDADEIIPISLQNEINRLINSNGDAVAYSIPRKIIIKGKAMKYSGLQTDAPIRLFKRGKANYDPKIGVHEIPRVNGKISKCENYMLHYTFRDYQSFKSKMEHYARIKALELHKKNKKANWYGLYIKPLYKFLYNYIFRLGFLDGKAGYMICKLNAYGVNYRYKELRRLNLASPE